MFFRASHPPDPIQASLLAVTQTAVGCGLGLLLAGRLGRPAQKTAAATMISVGVLLALPTMLGVVSRVWNRPGTDRDVRHRLDTIRRSLDYSGDSDGF